MARRGSTTRSPGAKRRTARRKAQKTPGARSISPIGGRGTTRTTPTPSGPRRDVTGLSQQQIEQQARERSLADPNIQRILAGQREAESIRNAQTQFSREAEFRSTGVLPTGDDRNLLTKFLDLKGPLTGETFGTKLETAGLVGGLTKAGGAGKFVQSSLIKGVKGIKKGRRFGNIYKTKSQGRGLKVTWAKNSKATKIIAGLVLGASALGIASSLYGSKFFGVWGQAEGPEGLNIVLKDVLREATISRNFSLFDEYMIIAEDIGNLSEFEEDLLGTPLAPSVGVPNKLKGVNAATQLLKKLRNDVEVRLNTGQTDKEYWAERDKERAEQEKANVDYFNEERKRQFDYEVRARAEERKARTKEERQARIKEATFWAREREKQRDLEAKERIAIADFWFAYRKEVLKLREDSSQSNLNFGIL